MELKTLLKELCEADGVGGVDGALCVAEKYLSLFAVTERKANNLLGVINPDGEKALLFDAHIDEIGFIVTSIEGGFLKVASVGGIDPRMLPAMHLTVHGKRKIPAVFCSVPPHLKDKDNENVPKITELCIDTGLKNAEDIVSPGDLVTFSQSFKEMGECVTGKALDDRAGCAALIRAAEILSENKPDCKVIILLSDMEEIGGIGAETMTYYSKPDAAVAVDVSFGTAPDVPEDKSGELSKGAMIGIAPSLSRNVINGLRGAAEKNGLAFQTEVMGSRTATNADDIAASRSGVPCGLLSIPLKNMHTPVEIVDVRDVETVAQILAAYAKEASI